MHYYIDGYNLLFYLSSALKCDLRKKRSALIAAFNEKIAHFSEEITLVFDGADLPYKDYVRGHVHLIEVVYTHEGLSADQYIVDRAYEESGKKQITVVSRDRELIRLAKGAGAHTMSLREFMALLEKKEKKQLRKKTTCKDIQDTTQNIARLEKIFTERLLQSENDETPF